MAEQEVSNASDIHPDVLELAQKIVDETKTLISGIETLDANNWLSSADKIEKLNDQLQNLLIPSPQTKTSKKSS